MASLAVRQLTDKTIFVVSSRLVTYNSIISVILNDKIISVIPNENQMDDLRMYYRYLHVLLIEKYH